MVNEFKRIINSKGTMIIVNFLIILLFVLICSYAFDTAPRSGFAYKKYTSFDELKSNISDVQNEIEMFKENQIDDPETLAIYQKRIMVGKFLLENEIEYDYLSFKV
ncbi:MAG: hypothetical protein LBF12_00645, partial [Christensenellaceae bacterium]|nr:hypothetical protein [Christensenellaceae bacterium]